MKRIAILAILLALALPAGSQDKPPPGEPLSETDVLKFDAIQAKQRELLLTVELLQQRFNAAQAALAQLPNELATLEQAVLAAHKAPGSRIDWPSRQIVPPPAKPPAEKPAEKPAAKKGG